MAGVEGAYFRVGHQPDFQSFAGYGFDVGPSLQECPAALFAEKDAILGADPLPAGCIDIDGVDMVGLEFGIVNGLLLDQLQLWFYFKPVEAKLGSTQPKLFFGCVIMAGGNVVLTVKNISGDSDQALLVPANILIAIRQPQQRLLVAGQLQAGS